MKRPLATGMIVAVILVAFATMAIWTAWDNGGGYQSTKMAAVCVFLGLVPFGAIAALAARRRCGPPGITVLACLVWVVALCQTVPLGESVVEFLSPGSASAYRDWIPNALTPSSGETSGDGHAATAATAEAAISVAPTYTRMALAGPALFGAACWLASICALRPRIAIWFLVATAVAGGLFAFFGLADTIRLVRDWQVELRQRLVISPVGADDPFGPFVNNNNCAGYLNLAIGCCLGLLSYATWRKPLHGGATGGSAMGRPWQVVACLLLVAVMVAGILGSASRGGFLGLVAGATVLLLTTFHAMPKWRLAAVLVIVAAISVLVLQGIGMRERAADRLETLYEGQALADPRLAHWHDALDAAMHYLPGGAGLGAYRYAYLPYQQKSGPLWFWHADGMPVEWLVEGGLWLLPLVLVGLVFLVRDLRTTARGCQRMPDQHARLARAIVTSGTFVVPAMLVTQTFDYGILHPPLLLTFAFIVGVISHAAASVREHREDQASNDPAVVDSASATDQQKGGSRLAGHPARTILGVGVAATLTFGLYLSARDLHVGAIVQDADLLRARNRKASLVEIPSYRETIDRIDGLVTRRPLDSTSRLVLAQLLIDEQQRLGAAFLAANQIGPPGDKSKLVAARTTRRALYTNDAGLGIDDLMLPTQDLRQWREARGHALSALRLCPLDDAARVMLVELDMVEQGANGSTPALLDQLGLLRRRNKGFLDYTQSLADAHPGGATAEKVRQLRAELQREMRRARLNP